MNAGAFSNEAAAKSAATLVAIKVDCTKEKQNEDIQKKYKVEGYPTVLFVTNEEKMVEDLYPEDGAEFAKQIDAFVKKHAKPAWAVPWSAALSKAGKPVVVLLPEKAPASWDDTRKELEKALGKDAEKLRFSYALPGSAELAALEKLLPAKARAGGFVVLGNENKPVSDPGPVSAEKRAELLKEIAR